VLCIQITISISSNAFALPVPTAQNPANFLSAHSLNFPSGPCIVAGGQQVF